MDVTTFEKQILGDLWTSPDLWNHMLFLCDQCGSRFATTQLEYRAGDYIMECFTRYGLENVHAESFEMPNWQRGIAHLTVLDDKAEIDIPCLALPGTHPCDLKAEIIDIGTGGPDDYQNLPEPATGKMVLTNSEGLGRMEKYKAAVEAGVAVFLFSSDQPGMLAPTGSIGKSTPAASVSREQAARIRRLLAKGAVSAHLVITSSTRPGMARNIVGEIPGNDSSQGWIVACGHYDGHDICQGAFDNAAGTAVLMESARLLAPLREHLPIGIRFVLFSGEELGLYGSYAYAAEHSDEMDTIRTVFNVDVVGMAMPLRLLPQSSPDLSAWCKSLPLDELDAKVDDNPKSFIMNSDHFPFSEKGVQAVWAVTSSPGSSFHWGHTAADTLDKLELRLLRMTAASITRLLLRMATDANGLPKGCKTPEQVKQSLIDAGFEENLRFQERWPFS